MSFDAARYKHSVLVPLAKDKARLEVLQRVIREVQGTGGESAAARLNVAELFWVEPSMGATELAAHLKRLEMTYNKQKNLPSAGLLKKLLDLFGKDKVGDPGFWADLASSRGQALKSELAEFAHAVAEEHPLDVVTPEQLSEIAAGMGLGGLVEADLAAALAEEGVEVRPDFEIPKVALPPAIRKVTEFPEFRTIVDVVLRPEQPTDMSVIEELTFGSPARRLEPADVAVAKKLLQERERELAAPARQAAQNALGVLADLKSASDIHSLTLAAIADATENLLRRGLPRVAVRAELVRRGLIPLDASRLVAKLSGSRAGDAVGAGEEDLANELAHLHDELAALARRVAAMMEMLPESRTRTDVAADRAGSEFPDRKGSDSLEVKQVLSRALGVRSVGTDGSPRVLFLLRANSPLPAEATVTMKTVVDGQTSISVALYEQGGEVESEDLEDNDLVGETSLDLPHLPAASTVEISLSVSVEGVLRLRARDPFSGRLSSVEANVSVREEEHAPGITTADTSTPTSTKHPAESRVLGVHLGHTHASVARINEVGQAVVLQNLDGEFTTPSVVYFEDVNSVVVGAEARRAQFSDPDNACSLIRRHMGTIYPQEFKGHEYTPEMITALILKELVRTANVELGQEINRVVITVPAYFGIQEKEATKQAGQIAGLEVVGLVTEPVAAVLSVGLGENPETIVVFDLGGMSFDVTVIQASPTAFEIVAIDGNGRFGGADWDEVLAQLVADKFVAQAGLGDEDPRLDAEFEIELLGQAEDTKKSLTRRENAVIRCRYYDQDEQISVSREEFEAATKHLVAQTLEISRRVVTAAEAKVPGLKVDRVLLVGGSSKMPMIDTALREQLGWNPASADFDLAVAKGAAIYGARLYGGHGSRGCSCCEEHFRDEGQDR